MLLSLNFITKNTYAICETLISSIVRVSSTSFGYFFANVKVFTSALRSV